MVSIKPICEYPFTTVPLTHQIVGFNYILEYRKLILGDEMGAGKTKQVLDAFGAIRLLKTLYPFLIVCGINGTKHNWLEEINKHAPHFRPVVIEGTKEKRLRLLAQVKAGEYDLAIINAESLRPAKRIKGKGKQGGEILDALRGIGWAGIAYDEAHKGGMKNPTSQVGKGIHYLKAEWMIAITGTPLINKPQELYNVLKWLGAIQANYWPWLHRLCTFGGYGGTQVVGYNPAELDKLKTTVSDWMLRRLKADCLDLPEKVVQHISLELSPEQKKLYNRVVLQTLNALDDPRLNAATALTKLLRLRQVLVIPDEFEAGCPSAKLDHLDELMEDIVANNKKAIIFSQWSQVTDIVRDRLAQYNPAYVTGDVPAKLRQAEVNRFQTDPDCKVIIGTIDALGTGFTCTAASYVIFTDPAWAPAYNEQAEDRAHRHGATDTVNVIYLSCQGTIDEVVQRTLGAKRRIFQDMMQDPVPTDPPLTELAMAAAVVNELRKGA